MAQPRHFASLFPKAPAHQQLASRPRTERLAQSKVAELRAYLLAAAAGCLHTAGRTPAFCAHPIHLSFALTCGGGGVRQGLQARAGKAWRWCAAGCPGVCQPPAWSAALRLSALHPAKPLRLAERLVQSNVAEPRAYLRRRRGACTRQAERRPSALTPST